MDQFPPNSQKARAMNEPKNLERVTSAEAVQRKRGLGRQFKETFVSGSARTAFEYMVSEVIVPAVRDMFADALQGGIDRLIYGETRRPRRGLPSGYENAPRINYAGMHPGVRPKPSGPRVLSRSSRARHEFRDIIIPSRQEAEEVLERMYDVLSRYGSVPVADLYELTGIQSSHTDHKWGWYDLRGAKASRQRNGGFLLDLPDPEPLG